MIETSGILLCVVAIIIFWFLWMSRRPTNFPPGPKPLPVFGNIHQLPSGHLFPLVRQWAKEYGPIIGLTAVGKPIILIEGVDHIHAALRKEEFQSRPEGYAVKARSFGKSLGIFFSNGEQWASSRKFVVKHVRAYGKNEKENIMTNEINRFVERIKDTKKTPGNGIFYISSVNVIWAIFANKILDFNDKRVKMFFNNLNLMLRLGSPSGGSYLMNISLPFRHFSPKFKLVTEIQEYIMGNGTFGMSSVNVIWTVFANKTLDFNDKRAQQFLNNLNSMFRQGSPNGGSYLLNIFPPFRHFSPKFKFTQKVVTEIQEYMRETIEEHREILDPNNPMDLIDHYLIEMEKRKNDPTSLFTEEDLITVGNDLFTAGAETTSNSIDFVLLYMVLYPHVQDKLQEEIDRVLGRSRKPTLEDRSEMNFTQAVITEIERLNSVAPTNAPRLCVNNTTFGGYFIPKGSIVLMNLRSLGYDLQYWEDPDNFYPERHLNAEGKYTKPSHLTTFGLGQRVCVGEVFARNVIFLFTATFFEKFSISLAEGEPQPSEMPLSGFTCAPQPFKIAIKSRY